MSDNILIFLLDLTLCCELQRHEINSIIKVSIEFNYFLIKKKKRLLALLNLVDKKFFLLIVQIQTSDNSLSLGKENTWTLGPFL